MCNDGTPAGYFFKAGSDPKQWLVYLEGGYWCWDSESCTERYQTDKFDMSSSGWSSEFAQEGIFGTDIGTNPFANENMVFVKVCPREHHRYVCALLTHHCSIARATAGSATRQPALRRSTSPSAARAS